MKILTLPQKSDAQNKERLTWQKALFFCLAFIPIIVIAIMLVLLVTNSMTAITHIGLFGKGELLSTEFSGKFTSGLGYYGLFPALWGTFLVVLLALLIAVPVALSLAIIATDFSFGFISPIIRSVLGLLSGIPPVVYALTSTVIGAIFIIPKFCAPGIPSNQLPLPGMSWWTQAMLPFNHSTLLGGILLALLIIPFMAPLMEDAIKNVPHSLKEASFALGANRWHTLTTVTIPSALSGISAAITLGTLKAMGDVIIVAWVVGYESGLPNPLLDIFEPTAPLTSTAAGLAGGFTGTGVGGSVQASVANFSGLILLVVAFVILGLSAYLQRKLRRKYSL